MASSGNNQFIARAQGHFFLQSDSTLDDQGGFINTSTGAFLSLGGTWTNNSNRALKHDFRVLDKRSVLRKIGAMATFELELQGREAFRPSHRPDSAGFLRRLRTGAR
jgi:hypothetical protein